MAPELLLAFQSGSMLYILCIVAGLAPSTFLTATLWSLQEQRARVCLSYIEGKVQIRGRQPGEKINTSTSGWVAGTALAGGAALVGASWGYVLWAVQQKITLADDSIAMVMATLGAVGLGLVLLILVLLTGSRGPAGSGHPLNSGRTPAGYSDTTAPLGGPVPAAAVESGHGVTSHLGTTGCPALESVAPRSIGRPGRR